MAPSSRRTQRPVAGARPGDAAPEENAGPEARGARRKRETRQRLLEAALELMADKGMEGVAINEITEKADVGFGSFYNHFESKEAIYDAVTDWVFESFADALDRMQREVADSAEVISISIRHTLLRARREPVWGRFLLREGQTPRALTRGLGLRLMRDIQRGFADRRFSSDDLVMTFLSVGGLVLMAISAQLQFGRGGDAKSRELARSLGFADAELPERTAATALKMLGLKAREADSVAFRDLPVGG